MLLHKNILSSTTHIGENIRKLYKIIQLVPHIINSLKYLSSFWNTPIVTKVIQIKIIISYISLYKKYVIPANKVTNMYIRYLSVLWYDMKNRMIHTATIKAAAYLSKSK